MTVQIIIDRNDIMKLSESLQYFTTLVTFIWKLTFFAINKKTLLQIEEILTSPIFYGYPEHHLTLLKQKIRAGQTAGTTFRILSVAAVGFWGLPCFFDTEKSKSLPVPGWFPYDVNKYYYPTFVFQILGIANTAYTDSSIDILSWILISIASGQFEVLKENLRSINYENDDSETVELAFKKCVKHHKKIIKFVYKIESMFLKGVFLQFFASVFIICFTGFLMMILPVVSMQFFLTFTYFVCMMCEVAVYCWLGHEVMTTSSTIGESLYMSNWYESNLTFRKNVVIFMEKTKTPVTMTAGGFVPLSLATLTSILRSSYSYFAVLQRLYDP
ncbi:hypothetical protein Zmor_015682 [Zophobas morio]|uniref:Odorant receptor n=2 Tax=Zophobas morio TaxID=2755281 RepID=A0AA38IIJ3_9CUCU|nr:hypothetical protein Zmor_015682 [Zophobas morio]